MDFYLPITDQKSKKEGRVASREVEQSPQNLEIEPERGAGGLARGRPKPSGFRTNRIEPRERENQPGYIDRHD